MKKLLKNIKPQYLHIAMIVLGIAFISLSIFHENLWFDESYTVGIVSKSFANIWTIGSNDVHPILYYWILHIFYLIFGSNIYIYRFFSMIPIAILSILGYTHIKKDFGEKVGFLFSFLTLFLPISCVYSGEIRMYTWAMLTVSVMSLYAYRIYQQTGDNSFNKTKVKNWILFAVFSLASCYIHYYGLATAGVMNMILFVYLIVKMVRERKASKENKLFSADLKCFAISAILQILLYLPWFIAAVILQLKGMSNGFWIPKPTAEIFLQLFIFQYTGDLDIAYISKTVAMIFAGAISLYALYCMIRTIRNNKKQDVRNSNIAGFWAIAIYFLVMLCIYIISLKKPLLYARYFLNLTGLFIFFLAFFIARGGRKLLTMILSIIIIIVSMMINSQLIQMNYDPVNEQPLAYIKQDLQEEDMILFDNRGSGFVISMQLIDTPNCFYDKENWNVEAAYAAFGKDMLTIKTLDTLKDYEGRIWVISSDDFSICDELKNVYGEKVKEVQKESFSIKYHNYRYTIALMEKQS